MCHLQPSLEPVCHRFRSAEDSYTLSGSQETGLWGCGLLRQVQSRGQLSGDLRHDDEEITPGQRQLGLEVSGLHSSVYREQGERPQSKSFASHLQAGAHTRRQRKTTARTGLLLTYLVAGKRKDGTVNITEACLHLTEPITHSGYVEEKRAAHAACVGPLHMGLLHVGPCEQSTNRPSIAEA